jgi:uncharacterized membrane protein (DUF485 family)
MVQRILSHPETPGAQGRRSTFGWWLTLAMVVVYYGFILLVTAREFLSLTPG